MSQKYQQTEVITGPARQQRWSTEQKLRISRRIADPGKTIALVAQRNGVAPNLLFRWRRVMNAGAIAAVGSNAPRPYDQSIRRNGGHDIRAADRK